MTTITLQATNRESVMSAAEKYCRQHPRFKVKGAPSYSEDYAEAGGSSTIIEIWKIQVENTNDEPK